MPAASGCFDNLWEGQLAMWRKCQRHISNSPTRTWAKDLSRHFSVEESQVACQHRQKGHPADPRKCYACTVCPRGGCHPARSPCTAEFWCSLPHRNLENAAEHSKPDRKTLHEPLLGPSHRTGSSREQTPGSRAVGGAA